MKTVRQWILKWIDENEEGVEGVIKWLLEERRIGSPDDYYTSQNKEDLRRILGELREDGEVEDEGNKMLLFEFNAYLCDEDGPDPYIGRAVVSVKRLLEEFEEIPCFTDLSRSIDEDFDNLSDFERIQMFYRYELKPKVQELVGPVDQERFQFLLNAYVCDNVYENSQNDIITNILASYVNHLTVEKIWRFFDWFDTRIVKKEAPIEEMSEDEVYCELYNSISVYYELRRCYLRITKG